MGREGPIGIIGAGPVGSILAAHLASDGHDVVLVECGPRRDQLVGAALEVVGKAQRSSRRFTLVCSLEDLAAHEFGRVFICTKACSLRKLLPPLAAMLKGEPLIVNFQNGIGPEEETSAHFPRDRVARVTVNFAGGVDPQTGVTTMQWFTPPNFIGPAGDNGLDLQPTAALLTRAGLATEAVSAHDIKKKVFYKTILNSALNALCASTGTTMRQAMSMAHTRSLAELLIREGLSVASAVGYYYGEDVLGACMAYLDAGGDHLPSMWMDLQAKVPTEIEYINGRIVQIGRMFKNVDVDANVFFTSMIITHEIKCGVRDPSDIPHYLTH